MSNSDTHPFHANGKLLLCGEYLVLDGAEAIGLPCQFGQSMQVSLADTPNTIFWKSFTNQKQLWYEGTVDLIHWKNIQTSNSEVGTVLIDLLYKAQQLNPDFLQDGQGFQVETHLEFPRLWGLGSSSTLIYTLAQWAQVNPFELSAQTLGGSGYDIACAGAEQAILYQIKEGQAHFEPIEFNPTFGDQLFFIYLSKKQNSRSGIKRYREKAKQIAGTLAEINQLTTAFRNASTLKDFQKVMLAHEQIIHQTIEMPKVQDVFFPDFQGAIKSLGAWGGDFILAATEMDKKATQQYFNKKGFEVFFDYNEMVL